MLDPKAMKGRQVMMELGVLKDNTGDIQLKVLEQCLNHSSAFLNPSAELVRRIKLIFNRY